MNKEQKQEVIETLKTKFSQYSNFYITDTQNLSVAQITNLRRHCFDKQVEMKVAKNTLIKKALESLDNDRYSGVYDSLHQVTALMFSDSPKEPALIISSFRKALNGERPLLKAAFLNGDIFVGDNQLLNLTKIKTKNELIGEVIGLLMSPIQRVIGALQNRPEGGVTEPEAAQADAKAEISETKTPVAEATPKTVEPKVESPESKSEPAPAVETKSGVVAPEATKPEPAEPTNKVTETPAEVKPETKVESVNSAATETEATAVVPTTEAEIKTGENETTKEETKGDETIPGA